MSFNCSRCAVFGAPAGTGGVAFWAHIGGFVVGAVMAKLLAQSPDRYGGPTY
ncbi:MAG: rhomboid family intramembrane serine protease [Caldilineaceae bacterium]